MEATLFDAHPPDPNNNAAPLAGGAGVNDPNTSTDDTFAKLPLTPPVRHNSPETSRIAAKRIAGHTTKQRADVLAVIVKAGAFGASDAEIEQATGIRAQSVSPRRGELRTLGLIVYSGKRRPTLSGCPAMVWVTPNHAPPTPKPEGGAT